MSIWGDSRGLWGRSLTEVDGVVAEMAELAYFSVFPSILQRLCRLNVFCNRSKNDGVFGSRYTSWN